MREQVERPSHFKLLHALWCHQTQDRCISVSIKPHKVNTKRQKLKNIFGKWKMQMQYAFSTIITYIYKYYFLQIFFFFIFRFLFRFLKSVQNDFLRNDWIAKNSVYNIKIAKPQRGDTCRGVCQTPHWLWSLSNQSGRGETGEVCWRTHGNVNICVLSHEGEHTHYIEEGREFGPVPEPHPPEGPLMPVEYAYVICALSTNSH